ncbi:hypothetical protein K435DRAFT_856188 [Dendrothele bispora CBS 962.96]|uniref:Uncharacterized protein n=1 Tax=Dendrothele bispora (strain CBS 962.96) TaxID=1314807 RepID=A0A4S8MAB1_DENBC|nr:hypothetical protein K435DRAFT_856188 [Dendrothele bispora CBS 962.96]
MSQSFVPPNRQPYVCHPLLLGNKLLKNNFWLSFSISQSPTIQTILVPPPFPIDPDRVIAILESRSPDNTGPNTPETPESRAIAFHLIQFLSFEVSLDRLPSNFLPLQSGLDRSPLQDTFIEFFETGKLGFTTCDEYQVLRSLSIFVIESYKNRLVLRSQQVANSPELIRTHPVVTAFPFDQPWDYLESCWRSSRLIALAMSADCILFSSSPVTDVSEASDFFGPITVDGPRPYTSHVCVGPLHDIGEITSVGPAVAALPATLPFFTIGWTPA